MQLDYDVCYGFEETTFIFNSPSTSTEVTIPLTHFVCPAVTIEADAGAILYYPDPESESDDEFRELRWSPTSIRVKTLFVDVAFVPMPEQFAEFKLVIMRCIDNAILNEQERADVESDVEETPAAESSPTKKRKCNEQ